MHVRFLVPANIRYNSGGNIYNARLTEGLRALGTDVEVIAVEGSWPESDAKERRRLASFLGARPPATAGASGTVTIVDGLIACGAPDELEAAAAAGHPAWVLLHMASPSHPDGERRALEAAAGVICTSPSVADHVKEHHGLPGARVALPGTDPAPVAAGSQPPHIVAVAALLPNKCQLLIVKALAQLKDLPWTASLVGALDGDPAYAEQVRAAIAEDGLGDRIRLTGQLVGDALAAEWHRADLSLLVSRSEAFGMVVTESVARGIPVIVREGTGAVDALALGRTGRHGGCGAHQPSAHAHQYRAQGRADPLPGAAVGFTGPERTHPDALAGAIRKWLAEAGLRAEWQSRALAARQHLPGWAATARHVLEMIGTDS